MRRRHRLPAALAIALVGLTGCSGTTSGADPTPTTATGPASASASASTSGPSPTVQDSGGEPTGETTDQPSGSPGADTTYTPRTVPANLPTTRIEAANLHYAYLGRNAASSASEQAVVDAWMSYWQGAADTYYLYRPTALFTSVARSSARSDVLDYLDKLKKKNERVVGWSIDNVTSVSIDADTATVRDCTENFTFSVDRESEPVSRVTPYYDVTGTLKRVDGGWTVVTQKSLDQQKSCLG